MFRRVLAMSAGSVVRARSLMLNTAWLMLIIHLR